MSILSIEPISTAISSAKEIFQAQLKTQAGMIQKRKHMNMPAKLLDFFVSMANERLGKSVFCHEADGRGRDAFQVAVSMNIRKHSDHGRLDFEFHDASGKVIAVDIVITQFGFSYSHSRENDISLFGVELSRDPWGDEEDNIANWNDVSENFDVAVFADLTSQCFQFIAMAARVIQNTTSKEHGDFVGVLAAYLALEKELNKESGNMWQVECTVKKLISNALNQAFNTGEIDGVPPRPYCIRFITGGPSCGKLTVSVRSAGEDRTILDTTLM